MTAAWKAWADTKIVNAGGIEGEAGAIRPRLFLLGSGRPSRGLIQFEFIDRTAMLSHFSNVKSLQEIEEAIIRLPSEVRRQLVQDLPALCPDVFPADGWDAILRDSAPRPALTSLLDKLDAEYQQESGNFLALNERSLRDKK